MSLEGGGGNGRKDMSKKSNATKCILFKRISGFWWEVLTISYSSRMGDHWEPNGNQMGVNWELNGSQMGAR